MLCGIKSLWIVWQSQVFDEHLYPPETEHSCYSIKSKLAVWKQIKTRSLSSLDLKHLILHRGSPLPLKTVVSITYGFPWWSLSAYWVADALRSRAWGWSLPARPSVGCPQGAATDHFKMINKIKKKSLMYGSGAKESSTEMDKRFGNVIRTNV